MTRSLHLQYQVFVTAFSQIKQFFRPVLILGLTCTSDHFKSHEYLFLIQDLWLAGKVWFRDKINLKLKALLHCAIFRATCLATPFLQTFSLYKASYFTSVKLSNVSCNLSRFDDHMRLKEHFHWCHKPLRHKLQDRCYTAQCLKNSLQPLRKVELDSTFRNVSATCLAMALRDKLHSVTAL